MVVIFHMGEITVLKTLNLCETNLSRMQVWTNGALKMFSLSGREGLSYIDGFARLRIDIFAEYPYLYKGDLESEREYISSYLSSPLGRIYALFDGPEPVGMLTCGPMSAEPEYMVCAFEKGSAKASESFYLGDMLLRKEYRGQGLFPLFFNSAKLFAQENSFRTLSLMCIVNSEDDVGRPKNFRDVVGLCFKLGFRKLAGASIDLDWPSISCGGAEKTHTLQFYIKDL